MATLRCKNGCWTGNIPRDAGGFYTGNCCPECGQRLLSDEIQEESEEDAGKVR